MQNKLKKLGVGLGLIGLGFAGANLDKLGADPVYQYQVLTWEKPTTDQGWAEDNEIESLNFRTDAELQTMLVSHQAKLIRLAEQYDPMIKYPDALRAEFEKAGLSAEEVEKQTQEKLHNMKWELDKLNQSIERMQKEIELRASGKIDRTQDLETFKNNPYQK